MAIVWHRYHLDLSDSQNQLNSAFFGGEIRNYVANKSTIDANDVFRQANCYGLQAREVVIRKVKMKLLPSEIKCNLYSVIIALR